MKPSLKKALVNSTPFAKMSHEERTQTYRELSALDPHDQDIIEADLLKQQEPPSFLGVQVRPKSVQEMGQALIDQEKPYDFTQPENLNRAVATGSIAAGLGLSAAIPAATVGAVSMIPKVGAWGASRLAGEVGGNLLADQLQSYLGLSEPSAVQTGLSVGVPFVTRGLGRLAEGAARHAPITTTATKANLENTENLATYRKGVTTADADDLAEAARYRDELGAQRRAEARGLRGIREQNQELRGKVTGENAEATAGYQAAVQKRQDDLTKAAQAIQSRETARATSLAGRTSAAENLDEWAASLRPAEDYKALYGQLEGALAASTERIPVTLTRQRAQEFLEQIERVDPSLRDQRLLSVARNLAQFGTFEEPARAASALVDASGRPLQAATEAVTQVTDLPVQDVYAQIKGPRGLGQLVNSLREQGGVQYGMAQRLFGGLLDDFAQAPGDLAGLRTQAAGAYSRNRTADDIAELVRRGTPAIPEGPAGVGSRNVHPSLLQRFDDYISNDYFAAKNLGDDLPTIREDLITRLQGVPALTPGPTAGMKDAALKAALAPEPVQPTLQVVPPAISRSDLQGVTGLDAEQLADRLVAQFSDRGLTRRQALEFAKARLGQPRPEAWATRPEIPEPAAVDPGSLLTRANMATGAALGGGTGQLAAHQYTPYALAGALSVPALHLLNKWSATPTGMAIIQHFLDRSGRIDPANVGLLVETLQRLESSTHAPQQR